jgi:hypothetical protein
MVAAVVLTTCQKGDNHVDMSQLVGEWYRTGVIGLGMNYTFDGDGGYRLVVGSFPNGSTLFEGKYEVSTNDGKIITLFSEDGSIREQYFLLELNSGKMRWKGIVYGGEGRETTFARATD